MTNAEIEFMVEGNKFIAEFIGLDVEKDGRKSIWNLRVSSTEKAEQIGFTMLRNKRPVIVGYLNFNERWDWIMPVVEHIEKGDFGFKMCRKVVEVYRDSTKEVLIKTKEASRIQSLFKAVVEFVKWKNTQE